MASARTSDLLDRFANWACEPGAVLLHSAVPGDARSGASFAGRRPTRVIEQRDGTVLLDGADASSDLLRVLRRTLEQARDASSAGGASGGMVGFIGYEAARRIALNTVQQGSEAAGGRLEAWFGLYDAIEQIEALTTPARCRPASPNLTSEWAHELSPEEVERRIGRVIRYIEAGDVYQANFTQRVFGRLPPGLSPFDLYRRLAARAPGPFSAFLNTGELQLASVSPERFLYVTPDGQVQTRPIKGTRPRDSDTARDAALAAELLASEKDRAENLMIADLMRNDLSRVAVPGSVRTPSLCALESFPGAHHLVSVVTAQLAPGRDVFDLLAATLPGGSITGAPKFRAMQVIDEIEAGPRGPYCGVLIRIGLDGSMDSSILIRTLVIEGERVTAQAGGGIVADSDPREEYREAMVKLTPLLAALAEP